MKKYNIYTDGACRNVTDVEKAIGGWAYCIASEDNKKIIQEDNGKLRKGVQNSTRAELEALYQVLLRISKFKSNTKFDLYIDNSSVIEGVTGIAERKANRDLWDKIEPIFLKLAGRIHIHKIEAHKSGELNEYEIKNKYVDKLAQIGANSLILAPVNN